MTAAVAAQRVSGLRLLASQSAELERYWQDCLNHLWGYSPWLEPLGLGRVLIKLSLNEAKQLARHLQARVGLGHSRYEAELAALSVAEGQVRLGVHPQTPLYCLRGVGLSQGSLQRLQWLGLSHLEQLRSWSKASLMAYLPEALALWPYLHPSPNQAVRLYRAQTSLKAGFAFQEAVQEPQQWLPVLHHLAQRLCQQLGHQAAWGLRLQLDLWGGLRQQAVRIAKAPLYQELPMVRMAQRLLEPLAALGIESLRLELFALHDRAHQPLLLGDQAPQLKRAVQEVQMRHPGALRRAVMDNPYTLASDQAFHWEAWR